MEGQRKSLLPYLLSRWEEGILAQLSYSETGIVDPDIVWLDFFIRKYGSRSKGGDEPFTVFKFVEMDDPIVNQTEIGKETAFNLFLSASRDRPEKPTTSTLLQLTVAQEKIPFVNFNGQIIFPMGTVLRRTREEEVVILRKKPVSVLSFEIVYSKTFEIVDRIDEEIPLNRLSEQDKIIQLCVENRIVASLILYHLAALVYVHENFYLRLQRILFDINNKETIRVLLTCFALNFINPYKLNRGTMKRVFYDLLKYKDNRIPDRWIRNSDNEDEIRKDDTWKRIVVIPSNFENYIFTRAEGYFGVKWTGNSEAFFKTLGNRISDIKEAIAKNNIVSIGELLKQGGKRLFVFLEADETDKLKNFVEIAYERKRLDIAKLLLENTDIPVSERLRRKIYK